jgi:hypothetical protein
MTITPTAADDGQLVYTADITRDNRITDRCLRKWIATGRFPAPDSNIGGRHVWLNSTYRRWREEMLAGAHRVDRRPPGQRTEASTP